jgi:hypothetical protein
MRHHGSGLASASAEVIEFEGRRFRDPFDIPASLSRKIPTALYPCIFRIIKAKYARVIRRGLRKPGARALLLCDRKVVATAQTPEEFELQEIRRIEHERDRVCFTYSEEDLVEECAWSSVGMDDAYPTLRIWLAPHGVTDAVLRDSGVEVVADFDTGNPRHPRGYYAFDDTIRESARIGPGVPGAASHLGTGYYYTRTPAVVGTADEEGRVRSHPASVLFVPDWSVSPFVRVNRERRGFVGREIMFGLLLRITLDPATRWTRVDFL